MRDDRSRGQVEDYTKAFLGSIYPVLLMALIAVWEVWSFFAALVVSVALHRLFRYLADRRAEREAAWDAQVEAVLARHRRP